MKNKIILLSDRMIEYFLYLMIFFMPFSNAGIEICFGFAFLAWIIKKVISYKLQVISYLPSTELNKPLLVFVLANAAAVIMSVNFSSSAMPFFSKTLEYLIIFFMVVDTINTKKRIRNVFAVIILSAFFISIDAGAQYFRGVSFLRGHPMYGPRLTASFRNPNDFGGWLVIMVFIILGLFLNRQKGKILLKKIGLTVLFFFLLICLVLTYSRGAWIGFLIGLIIVIGYKIIRFPWKIKGLSILLIIAFGIGTFFLLPSTMQQRIESVGNVREASPMRLTLWREAWSIIKDFPVFGAGLNTYMEVSSGYSAPGGGQGIYYPHSAYLHMAAEIGLVGLACFLWVLVRFFRLMVRGLKERRDSPLPPTPRLRRTGRGQFLGLLAGISAFLAHSFFDTNLYSLQLAALFWFMLGLGVSIFSLDSVGNN